MSNQDQQNEKSGNARKISEDNNSANQDKHKVEGQGMTKDTHASSTETTSNSNENSASGANKGPAGSYNENDANPGSQEQHKNAVQGLDDAE